MLEGFKLRALPGQQASLCSWALDRHCTQAAPLLAHHLSVSVTLQPRLSVIYSEAQSLGSLWKSDSISSSFFFF